MRALQPVGCWRIASQVFHAGSARRNGGHEWTAVRKARCTGDNEVRHPARRVIAHGASTAAPLSVTRKIAVLIVLASIGSLKVALIARVRRALGNRPRCHRLG